MDRVFNGGKAGLPLEWKKNAAEMGNDRKGN